MRKARNTAAGLVIGILAGVLVACNGSSDAGTSGVSQAAFNQLKATVAGQADAIAALQKQIKALQGGSDSALKAKLSHLYLRVSTGDDSGVAVRSSLSLGESSGGARTLAETADTTCTGLGTFLQNNGDRITGKSCSGFMYYINAVSDGSQTHFLPTAKFVFAQAGCAGPAYIEASSILEIEKQGGVVFSLPKEKVTDWSDPSNYYYLPPNPVATQITVLSAYYEGGPNGCAPNVPYQTSVYEALPNDPTITKVPSGTVTGPVGAATL